jgi:hypothetical protein
MHASASSQEESEAAAAERQGQKELEKARQEQQKKKKAHTDNASATIELLKDATSQLQEEIKGTHDEYLKQSCELACEKAKTMIKQATDTLTEGCELPFDLQLARAVQAEAISKTRTSHFSGPLKGDQPNNSKYRSLQGCGALTARWLPRET